MLNKIKEFFFQEDESINLQVVKLIICATLLIFSSQVYDLLQDSLVEGYDPIGIFKFLPQVTSKITLNYFSVAFRLFLLLAILNIFTQASLIGAYICGLYVMVYKYNFGTVYHGNWAIMFGLLILCFVPNSTWKPGYKGIHARWSLRLIQLFIAWVYTSAGIQKLMRSGFGWIWSENLAIRIFNNKMTWAAQLLLDSPPVLVRILQAGVLLIEVTSLAIFFRRMRKFYLCAWLSLHIGIQIVFFFHWDFLMNIALHSSFVAWNLMPAKWFSAFSIGRAKSSEVESKDC